MKNVSAQWLTVRSCCGPQEPEAGALERWGQGPDTVGQLQSRVQQLETENTDFLAALEDAMEQYKQQVRQLRAVERRLTADPL